LIDTAGLRKTNDTIEAIGVERTLQQMEKASMIVYLFDASEISLAEIEEQIQSFNAPYVLVGNKQDKLSITQKQAFEKAYPAIIWISASENQNIESLQKTLFKKSKPRKSKQEIPL
jgi:tRNA modification GTPase